MIPAIRELISRDKLERAIETILSDLNISEIRRDEIVMISSNLAEIKKKENLRLISDGDATVSRNKIRSSILDWLRELERDGVTLFTAPEPQIQQNMKIRFLRPFLYPATDRDGIMFRFDYELIAPPVHEYGMPSISGKTLHVAISGSLSVTWGFPRSQPGPEHIDRLSKVLWVYGKDYIFKAIKNGTLKDFDELVLLTSNCPHKIPYDIARIPEIERYEEDVVMIKKEEPPEPLAEGKGGVENGTRTKVFVSYSHADKEFLMDVRRHFKPLRNKVDLWDDTRIQAGAKWREEIEAAIEETKVAILLVSTDFLGSDFIHNNELPPLLEAAEEDGAKILIVILKPCLFDDFPSLNQYQALNDPRNAVIGMNEYERESLFVDLVRNTKELLS